MAKVYHSRVKRQRFLILVGILCLATGIGFYVSNGRQHVRDKITVAAIIPITGWSAEFGSHERCALQAAVEWTQKEHPSIEISVDVKDTASETKNALSTFQSLNPAPKIALVESSSASLAIAPLISDGRTLMLSISASPETTKQSDFIIRCMPSANEEVAVIAPYAINQLKIRRLAFLYINNDYGNSYVKPLEQTLQTLDSQLRFSESFASETVDFRSQVEKLKASESDGVFIVGYGAAMGNLIAALRSLSFDGPVMACSSVIYDDVLSVAKNSASRIVYADIPFDTNTQSPEATFFNRRYMDLSGKAPSPLAAMTYDAARLSLEAMISEKGEPKLAIEKLIAQGKYMGINKEIRISKTRDLRFGLVIKRVP